MSLKGLEILFFYNKYNPESLKTRSDFFEVFAQNNCISNIKINSIDIDKYPLICKKYNINGIPTTLIFKNDVPVLKVLGQLFKKDLKLLMKELNNKPI